MEKNNKKVIISTIIAVTLLIALVVGATYAYFQANNTATGTTNLDASTEKVGTVVVENPTENLYLKLSAYEMQQSLAGTSYYATSTNGSGTSVYSSTAEDNVLANYTISGGEEDTIYNCTFNLNITKPSGIQSGDMILDLDGANIGGNNTLNIDLSQAQSTYVVEFTAIGNVSGNLVKGDIKLNNTSSDQTHIEGATLETNISVSDLNCEVKESICELVSGTEGSEGAKYNCGVSPNAIQTFYLLDNNDDGTSDLIMNANINASGEKVIPGVTSDTGEVAWYSDETNNKNGPVTAMTYLHNVTKSWTNVEPLNYSYYDREVQGITTTDRGYQSFISTNGIATITAGDTEGTQITIGSASEPLRARMPMFSFDANITEVTSMTNASYLYDNFDAVNYNAPYGYWTLSSDDDGSYYAWGVFYLGDVGSCDVDSADSYGVRPVITIKL